MSPAPGVNEVQAICFTASGGCVEIRLGGADEQGVLIDISRETLAIAAAVVIGAGIGTGRSGLVGVRHCSERSSSIHTLTDPRHLVLFSGAPLLKRQLHQELFWRLCGYGPVFYT